MPGINAQACAKKVYAISIRPKPDSAAVGSISSRHSTRITLLVAVLNSYLLSRLSKERRSTFRSHSAASQRRHMFASELQVGNASLALSISRPGSQALTGHKRTSSATKKNRRSLIASSLIKSDNRHYTIPLLLKPAYSQRAPACKKACVSPHEP